MSAGVDPGILTSQTAPSGQQHPPLANLEMGAFFQDDWKVTRNLTLNLGIRYDLYTRHTELNNQVTTLSKGRGATSSVDNANVPAGRWYRSRTPSDCTSSPIRPLGSSYWRACSCGPGGFTSRQESGQRRSQQLGTSSRFRLGRVRRCQDVSPRRLRCVLRRHAVQPTVQLALEPAVLLVQRGHQLPGWRRETVIYGPYTCTPTCATAIRRRTPTFTGPANQPQPGHRCASQRKPDWMGPRRIPTWPS